MKYIKNYVLFQVAKEKEHFQKNTLEQFSSWWNNLQNDF